MFLTLVFMADYVNTAVILQNLPDYSQVEAQYAYPMYGLDPTNNTNYDDPNTYSNVTDSGSLDIGNVQVTNTGLVHPRKRSRVSETMDQQVRTQQQADRVR